MVGDLLELISERRPRTLADSDEESVTFMDLPREILSVILRCALTLTEFDETLISIIFTKQ